MTHPANLSRGTGTHVKAVPGKRCLLTTATAIVKPRHDREIITLFCRSFQVAVTALVRLKIRPQFICKVKVINYLWYFYY